MPLLAEGDCWAKMYEPLINWSMMLLRYEPLESSTYMLIYELLDWLMLRYEQLVADWSMLGGQAWREPMRES
jgi:hypothetical protein